MKNKSGQVTIFIIIAIVIVVAVAGFFILRGNISFGGFPSDMQPVHETFLSCLEEDVLTGASILGSQAGYIDMPDFESGSTHMPFSSQLDFLGNPVPYWYYVSANNIQKEQVPSKSKMEEQLEEFVEQRIEDCRLDEYYEQGFEINLGEPEAYVKINDENIRIDLDMELEIIKGEESAKQGSHDIKIESNLGKLYESAKKVYDFEQDNLFLEEYALDTLNLYAPVSGVEISCSPQVWNAEEVFDDLEEAIEANTLAINVIDDEYFEVDLIDEDIKFINSRNWAHGFEVSPTQGAVLVAEPVGNQPGLGILGFCYAPYQFVYNVKYPVLIQISEDDDIFQFPMAVVIQGNNPRESLSGTASDIELPKLCEYKNTPVTVRTYDNSFSSIDADISFECFGTKCNIGETAGGSLKENFPQCVNGYVLAQAEGYLPAKQLHSTTSSGTVEIILDKLHEVDVNLRLDGTSYNGEAIVSFSSDRVSATIAYPEQKTVKLAEGQYEISVQIYRSSDLKLNSVDKEQCVEVPRSGIGGLFGLTTTKCVDISIPSQVISNVLAGGGTQEHYMLDSQLRGGRIDINAPSLTTPKTIEDLQVNYLLFESKGLVVSL